MSDSQQKLKICILTLQFPPFLGGVATSTERLAVYMSQKGHEVHIISPGYLSLDKIITNPIKSVLENGYFVHRTFPSLANYLAHNPTENSIIFEYISGLHKKINFDLFHGMFLIPPGFMAVNLGKIFNKPSIASVRGSDVEVFMHSPLYLHPVRRVIAEANIVTGNTLAQIKKIKKISSPQKIFKTPLSINLNLFEKKSLSECIKDFPFIQKLHALVLLNKKRYFKTKFICITGYMRYQKNFETLLKAFKKVLSVKPNTHLLLIGDFTDASRKKYYELMKMLKIKNKVNITGNIPLKYIFAWLKKCDVFVLPSRYEMPSNSLLEAMATGIPVVVSDFEGVEEIVENEQTGLISKMNDSDSLAESILRILNDESLGSRLASNAKRKAEKEFSASDNEAVFWEKVYLEAVDDFNKNNNYQS